MTEIEIAELVAHARSWPSAQPNDPAPDPDQLGTILGLFNVRSTRT